MKINILAINAVTGMAFGGAAFGQTMIGGQEITSGDLAAVTAHCEMLAAGGATTDVAPGNTGNPDTTGLEANADASDLGDASNEDVVAGNEGNPNAGESDANEAADGMVGETDVAADGNSGNVDAEAEVATLNLQDITLADCEAAGL